jgi:hypothetical protein
VASVARELPADGTGVAAHLAGDLRFRFATYQERADSVAFLLRELMIPTHVCVLFLVEIDVYGGGSQLSRFYSRALHLLLEFAEPNKSLQLSLSVSFVSF